MAQTIGRLIQLGRPIPGYLGEVSRCHDIVYHEAVHAVLYGFGIQPGGEKREAGALHEGLADYLAAACTEDPAIAEWLYLPFPLGVTRVDQPVNPFHMSQYDRVTFGGAGLGSVHANGMILSSGLWDLRARIASTADSLVVEALDHLPTLPTFGHLANGLLQADAELHADRAFPAIVEALTRRGIRGLATAAMSGPTSLEPGETGEFQAIPCCGPASGAFRWRMREWCRGAPCGDWRSLGQGLVLRTSFAEDAELGLEVYTSWGDTLRSTRFVSVRPPRLVVEGSTRVVQGGVGSWRARVEAMGPWRVDWERTWRRPGARKDYLGVHSEVAFAADTSFDLDVTLTDGVRREVRTRLGVATFADRPPRAPDRELAVSVVLGAGARRAELRFETPRTEVVRVEVLDVSGRVRAEPWNGTATAGGHVVSWDVSGLEPGVYFVRARNASRTAVERFLVLR